MFYNVPIHKSKRLRLALQLRARIFYEIRAIHFLSFLVSKMMEPESVFAVKAK